MKNIVKVVSIGHPTSLVIFQGEIKARQVPTVAMREHLNKQLESIYKPESVETETLLANRIATIFPPTKQKSVTASVLAQYERLKAKKEDKGHTVDSLLCLCIVRSGILS